MDNNIISYGLKKVIVSDILFLRGNEEARIECFKLTEKIVFIFKKIDVNNENSSIKTIISDVSKNEITIELINWNNKFGSVTKKPFLIAKNSEGLSFFINIHSEQIEDLGIFNIQILYEGKS